MPKISDHEEFLNASMVNDGDLIVMLDPGKFRGPQETGFARTVFQILIGLPDQRTKIWTMNKTTQRRLAEAYGDDTADWVKKMVKVEISKQTVQGVQKNVLYGWPATPPEEMRISEYQDTDVKSDQPPG